MHDPIAAFLGSRYVCRDQSSFESLIDISVAYSEYLSNLPGKERYGVHKEFSINNFMQALTNFEDIVCESDNGEEVNR